MALRRTAIGLIAAMLACSAVAAEQSNAQKTITEMELRRISREAYSELLRQAESRGHSFSAESIAKGYRRHLEELRLQLIDAGFSILAGESSA